MHFHRILVKNFRGVRLAEASDLKKLVVIAGQNGSGKSCLFDAVRLLKSAYGGYQPNESQQWFEEFQINLNRNEREILLLFNDKNIPIKIEVEIGLTEHERKYIDDNRERLVRDLIWSSVAPELYRRELIHTARLTPQYRNLEPQVDQKMPGELMALARDLEHKTIIGRLVIKPDGRQEVLESKLLQLLFSTYEPGDIGLVDYHGPHRLFNREFVQNINVDLSTADNQRRSSSLYNYNQKYSNVKSEMASAYVREAIATVAGVSLVTEKSITLVLEEMFRTFFPHKHFLGPTPKEDGTLAFPVTVGGEEIHDLNELSSGEKEILYGYLRLRNSAPMGSVILLDEPELHLNPKLVARLGGFYFRNLCLPFDNQVFLITHSDALLR